MDMSLVSDETNGKVEKQKQREWRHDEEVFFRELAEVLSVKGEDRTKLVFVCVC